MENYFLNFLKITEQSALACHPLIGKGEAKKADQVAVDKMRSLFQQLPIDVQIVIGEGERDEAPRLYTGERLGDKNSNLKIDVAVDPLEGTTLCAEGREGALSVMALALRGGLFKAPDIYMKKLACGAKAKGAIDLSLSPEENILAVSKALNKKPEEMLVGVLKRERHKNLIESLKKTKASIRLVDDGDVALALETSLESSPLDLLIGTGGAPEGVLAAAALKCLGGDFQAQLIYRNEEEKERAKNCGVKDLHQILRIEDLVSKPCFFYATGVTSGSLLNGICKEQNFWTSHSLILSEKTGRKVKSHHQKAV